MRRFRPVEEKRRIVEATLEPGASVARVAQQHGVNANQVFQWRRLYEQGHFAEAENSRTKLLPVTIAPPDSSCAERSAPAMISAVAPGTMHLELPGKALLSMEGAVDPRLARAVLECLLR